MRPLFDDHKKYAYLLILALSLSSVFFASRPTGMVTSASSNALVDAAFSSDAVRDFAANNPDFRVSIEELTADKMALLQQEHPQLYSNLPETRIYQMILDAHERALIILLNEQSVFKVWEPQL